METKPFTCIIVAIMITVEEYNVVLIIVQLIINK